MFHMPSSCNATQENWHKVHFFRWYGRPVMKFSYFTKVELLTAWFSGLHMDTSSSSTNGCLKAFTITFLWFSPITVVGVFWYLLHCALITEPWTNVWVLGNYSTAGEVFLMYRLSMTLLCSLRMCLNRVVILASYISGDVTAKDRQVCHRWLSMCQNCSH